MVKVISEILDENASDIIEEPSKCRHLPNKRPWQLVYIFSREYKSDYQYLIHWYA
jgi:hypothetical protein